MSVSTDISDALGQWQDFMNNIGTLEDMAMDAESLSDEVSGVLRQEYANALDKLRNQLGKLHDEFTDRASCFEAEFAEFVECLELEKDETAEEDENMVAEVTIQGVRYGLWELNDE